MQYFAGTREFQIKEPTAVTIGKFDGLHRGHLVEYPFNQEVAHMDPEQFVAEILVGKMGAKAIVSGPDCHFGYQRKGDAELLRKLAPKYGYEVSIVEKAMDGDREISSTYIR